LPPRAIPVVISRPPLPREVPMARTRELNATGAGALVSPMYRAAAVALGPEAGLQTRRGHSR
jgi:hypothetical protein